MKAECDQHFQHKSSCLLLAIQPCHFQTRNTKACFCRLEIGSHPQVSVQQPLLHVATVTASQACDVLMLSAQDLARFGPELVSDVQQYAQQRLDWRHHRMGICKNAAQVCMPALLLASLYVCVTCRQCLWCDCCLCSSCADT